MPIPVIDLFAGPGGLGEGFASLDDGERFDVRLSIEKDATAHRTLWLRALYRQLDDRSTYLQYRRSSGRDRATAFQRMLDANRVAAERASGEAWRVELGSPTHNEVRARVKAVLSDDDRWVLIGGPPCQAYSLVGRSRMRRVRGDTFELDERHRLYQQYLKIIADHRPAVFVMENVKGLLSSQLDGGRVFHQILDDLAHPGAAVQGADGAEEYTIHPVVTSESTGVARFLVRAEEHGVPQARHRVILVGLRKDVTKPLIGLTPSTRRVSAADVIGDLPHVRSGLSQLEDTPAAWLKVIKDGRRAITEDLGSLSASPETVHALKRGIERAADCATEVVSRGRSFVEANPSESLDGWYADAELGGITGHETRTHMETDLWRYLFAASFAEVQGRSPTLPDFPPSLLPAHRNVTPGAPPIFADRFRVQLRDRPSTTITSHISKDGHGFIHYDAPQVRSLTAREAARLQTFPDSYEFEGPRTEQLHQIGNAVPPLLARRIARVVYDILE